MAVSIGTLSRAPMHDYLVVVDITLDNNYVTGGYALTASQFGFAVEIKAIFPNVNGNTTYDAQWNPTTAKLMMQTGANEVNNGTDLSAVSVRCLVIGR